MRDVKKGSTDQSVIIRIVDSGDGTPETAVEHNTSGIDLWYRREGAAKVSITEAALSALTDAHSDGGIEHIGDGYYRLDLPDAAFASGANGVLVGGTVTGMVVIGCYVHLVDYDPQDTVRMGLTALPNAAADAAGGLVISDLGGFDIDNRAPSATSVANMNIVFNTDFATAYNTTLDKWDVNATHAGGTAWGSGAISANVIGTAAITAAKFAAGAIDAAATSVDFLTEIRNAITGGAYALDTDANGRVRVVDGTGAGELDTSSGLVGVATIAANAVSASALATDAVNEIVDQVWREALADHSGTAGSTAEALNAAGAAGDPWTTNLPGAYGAGSAGYIIGTNLNATISSRSSHSAADVWSAGTRTLTALGFTLAASDLAADTITAAKVAADVSTEIRNAITGGAYALDTDANGRIRIVDGTAAGELDTASGGVLVSSVAANALTAAALATDAVAEIQSGLSTHAAADVWAVGTRTLTALDEDATTIDLDAAIRAAVGLAAADLDTKFTNLPASFWDLADGIETSITPRQAMRAVAAKAAGLISGAGTGTEVVKGIGQASGGTTRLTATVDVDGNITAWTLNL